VNTIEHLRHLYEYDDWANRRVLAALRVSPSGRSLRIYAHILTTQQEYFDRLHGKDSTGFDFWPELSIEECADLASQTKERFEMLLDRFDEEGLDLNAAYNTSGGVPHSNTFREILTHVLFHSAIHRGNIILKLREEGVEPPQTDYIVYLRETT
jgi:uncharacterized damage-inducible protein DinB